MSYKSFISIIITLYSACNTVKSTQDRAYRLLDAPSFNTEMQAPEVQLVDLRTPKEYGSGHLKGAINVNYYDVDFIAQMKTLDLEKPVFVYCHIGGRSRRASKKLQEAGFVNVVDLKGGIVAWKAARLTLIQ